MTAITSFAQLQQVAQRKTKTVPIRGVDITIAELSLDGRDAFLAAAQKGTAAAAVAVVAQGAIHPETGEPLMTAEEAETLAKSSAGFVQDIASAILKLSGLGDEVGNE